MADPKFQLVQLFGSSDLLEIVGIKSMESYQNSIDDVNLLKQSYLRQAIRFHPSSCGLNPLSPEGIKETVTRGKKLYVMNDIFKFLTDNKPDKVLARKDYFAKGIIPDLPSLQYLRENAFKGNESDYKVPEFEEFAAELKALYLDQMRKIRELQQSTYTTQQ